MTTEEKLSCKIINEVLQDKNIILSILNGDTLSDNLGDRDIFILLADKKIEEALIKFNEPFPDASTMAHWMEFLEELSDVVICGKDALAMDNSDSVEIAFSFHQFEYKYLNELCSLFPVSIAGYKVDWDAEEYGIGKSENGKYVNRNITVTVSLEDVPGDKARVADGMHTVKGLQEGEK